MCNKDKKISYTETVKCNQQNDKSKGSLIFNTDTSRGCNNNCFDCYPDYGSMKIDFKKVVLVKEYEGKPKDDAWYRFGNSGDPANNWKHSEKIVEKKGFKNFFCVTKLQNIKGFTGFFNKLQVSVDPLNPHHFGRTLDNVEKILKQFPKVKIILRVRSVSTTDFNLLYLMDVAVKFANTHNLPIMETRMRFKRKIAFEKFKLVKEDYDWRGNYFRPKHGMRFIVGAKKYYDCDLYGAKCENCSNCTLPWTTEQFKKKGEFIAPSKSKRVYKEAA